MSRFLLLSEPRSGSTLLHSLLKQHNQIHCKGELLKMEIGKMSEPLQYVEELLSRSNRPVVGFKTFPEDLIFHGLSVLQVVRQLNIKWVIVLWRKSCLETYTSLLIANKTNQWCSTDKEPSPTVEIVTVDPEEFRTYIDDVQAGWERVCRGWPPDVVPIFVQYERLIENVDSEVGRILWTLSLHSDDYVPEVWFHKQNPASLEEKVSTWSQLPEELREASVDFPSIVNRALREELGVEEQHSRIVPDREPPPPPDGWRYRVAQPYITSSSRQNVLDAIDSGSVSSAGFWPAEMARKLKALFGVPTVQPCCNGFGALVLALRAASIGPGDEVIIPSFTMIAVPNSVYFVGARPVPVDNAVNEYNPSLREILTAATKRTKAVIVTHTYGVPTKDMESLVSVCAEKHWFLFEDISECAGISTEMSDGGNRLLGTFGDFACASMYANKILQAADGGFVLAKSTRHSYRLESLVNHGFTRSFHFVHIEKAPNFKIDGLSAAMACASLDAVDYIIDHRHFLAQTYRDCLKQIPLRLMPKCGPFDTPWVLGVECASRVERQQLRTLLADHGIETRNYFFPLHAQPAYGDVFGNVFSSQYPNANYLAETGFYLPTFTHLEKPEIEWICSVIISFFDPSQSVPQAPHKPEICNSVRVNQETLELKSRQLSTDGSLVPSNDYEVHHMTNVVTLRATAKRYLAAERWDKGEILCKYLQECMAKKKKVPTATLR